VVRFRALWHHAGVKTRIVWIPAAAVLIHEHVERLLQDGDLGSLLASEPAVLAGLALQVPVGLVALWLVTALLRTANELGFALTRSTAQRFWLPAAALASCSAVTPLRARVLASLHAGRAPPSFA
jgi:hypothetical protein